MRKSLRSIVSTLIFMIMFLTILTPAAMAAENPSLEISATVTLSGAMPESPEDFSIKLSADEMSNPMPMGSLNGISTMIITGGGTVTFPKITYDRVGAFNYTLWQESGLNPDATYDSTIYHLTVFVTNAAMGGLEIATVVYKEDETEKSSEIVFNNSYASPAEVKFRALKTLDGKTPSNGKFKFLLTDEAGNVLQTKTNLGQDVEFDSLPFNKIGAYNFYILEEKGNDVKINYDTTIYKAIVIVTKNSEGNYVANVSYMKGDEVFTGTPTFINQTIPELPNTGESQSALPIIGVLLILGGVALTMRRKVLR